MKRDESLRIVFQAMNEIAIISHLADTAFSKVLPPNLSIAGFGVLNHFVRLSVQDQSPVNLARAFQVTKGAMTYTLKALEEQGYVSIAPDAEDRRGKLVNITPRGRRAREEAQARVAPELAALLAAIPAQEFADALPFLVKLRQTLDAARD